MIQEYRVLWYEVYSYSKPHGKRSEPYIQFPKHYTGSQSASSSGVHVQTNKYQQRRAWIGAGAEGPMIRFGFNLSTNLCHPREPDFGTFLVQNMGIGIVELSIFSGSTKSFLAKIERRMGNVLTEVTGEDLFPGQNRHLAMISKVSCEA